MDDDAFERVTGVFADSTARCVEYVDVWRGAVARNASGEYAADDFLVDLQTVWGMAVRDAARMGAAWVDMLAPLVGRPDGEGNDEKQSS